MSIFSQILQSGAKAGYTPATSAKARQWFRDKARDFAAGRSRMMREGRKVSAPEIGSMYHFIYDPKGKKTLPYYDKFPLIFMVGPAEGGFYGINLHYLPPTMRAVLMDKLYTIVSDRKYDANTKLRLSYDVMKGAAKFRYFKPTFKHYLTSHVKSQFMKINADEWDIALMLPTQNFAKASSETVYADSRKAI
jgi:hypothetical protein